MVEPEPAAIDEKTVSLITAKKDDRGKTVEKDLTAEAAWPEDGLRIAGPKMGAGTAAASSGEIVSESNIAESPEP